MLIGQVLDDQPPDHIGHSSPTPRPVGPAGPVSSACTGTSGFVLSHADGFLPYAFERMALTIARDGVCRPRKWWSSSGPSTSTPRCRPGTAALPTVLAFARPGHLVFGTDWPFAPQPLVDPVTAGLHQYAGIDEGGATSVDQNNAVALFSW